MSLFTLALCCRDRISFLSDNDATKPRREEDDDEDVAVLSDELIQLRGSNFKEQSEKFMHNYGHSDSMEQLSFISPKGWSLSLLGGGLF